MKKIVSIASEHSTAGKKKMTDKDLAVMVHQYHPGPFSIKTVMVLCSSIRYLSFIGILEHLFQLDSKIATLTQSCKLVIIF